ncbi:unnamed protein product, partial [Musa textilis]
TVSFSTATATAAFSLAKGGIFLCRALIAAAFSSENGGCCGFLSVTEPYDTRYLSLTPLPPFVSALPLPRHHPPPPCFTRSSQPPPPVDPDSHLHRPPTPPIPTAPSPFSYSGPDCPLSIILLRPRQPPSPSYT